MAVESLENARALFVQRRWAACAETFASVGSVTVLGPEDLLLSGTAAYLAGRDSDAVRTLATAFRSWCAAGSWEGAVRTAFWLAYMCFMAGEPAQGSAWAGRAVRVVEEHHLGGAAAGHALLMRARQQFASGSPADAGQTAVEVVRLARGESDDDLETLARLTIAEAQLTQGLRSEALASLDEVMLAVTSGGLGPVAAGQAYCGVIAVCVALFDWPRAGEWTAALNAWCDTQPDLVPYRGQCLVHRAQILGRQGRWDDALVEARAACERGGPMVGDAWYEIGEIHRLRGQFSQAERAFRTANSCGRQPEPGLALLRMAQGRNDVAAATVQRLYDEGPARVDRPVILAAYVEVMEQAGDRHFSREAAEELARLADEVGVPLLAALAAQAVGTCRLAEDPASALAVLRRAWRVWDDLEMPYEAARTRVQIGRCLAALGDEESATLEHDAAREVFERLGAVSDLRALNGEVGARPEGLTVREVEVLRFVASGLTNRDVASALVLSEKTVARHLANIYIKLGVSSRAAATAYAYEHGLAGR